MISLMASGGLALWAAGLGTPLLIHWLVRRRIGQQIRADGPFMHQAKAGTPTMGGVAIVLAAIAGYVISHFGTHVAFSRPGILVVAATVGAGGIGLVDDWIKVRHRRSLGLNKRGKLGALV
ncbi:MAG: phospho-N-acetylmuramoyl-pentapeptide-transferase, partial [Acidimicrobiales bacterium]